MCQDCQQKDSNTSFLFGIFIGAIIASLVAILIYKNQKTEVFERLKKYLKDLLSPYLPTSPSETKTSTSSRPITKKPVTKSSPSSLPKPVPATPSKIEVELPQNLKTYNPTLPTNKAKPVKMFRKAKA